MKLRLDKNSWYKLRKLGIQGLGIIIFDDALGPVPKYVYSKHTKLIKKILRDRAFASKISILAKYSCEAKLSDDSRIVLECFDSRGERLKTNYIIAQIGENAQLPKIRAFLKSLKRKLNGLNGISKELLESCLKKIL